ncbi:MAG: hypothetical protein IKF19_04800 [Bacilli bacterium]|nr:hypothetical protein [Bacilli bacterium]
MDIQEKLKIIKYTSYTYKGKKWNSEETKDFFDLDFTQLLYNEMPKIINNQKDLLQYFDFKDIFNNFDNGINNTQELLLKFMAIKGVNEVASLLNNMPNDLEKNFFYELYLDLHSKDNKPIWLSKITKCMKDQNKIEFITNIINDITDDEILNQIRDLYENKNDSTLKELLNNQRFANVAIERINCPFFYEMIEELNLPTELLEKRQKELTNIIENYQDYDAKDIKNAYCDLYFHDTPNNLLLDLKTIIEFADSDEQFKNDYLGEMYTMLTNIYTSLSKPELLDRDIKILNNNKLNHEMISKCYLLCQQRFKKLVSQSINKDVTNNIKPKLIKSSTNKTVSLYSIENQTDLQKNIPMLISSIPYSENASKFKQIYYSNQNGEIKNKRRSCSLINERKLNSTFGGNNRIIFGYNNLHGRMITSATLGDGRTDGNEERFRKHRKVLKNSYLPVDKFIANTQGHTELTINMGKTNEVMKPNYILITHETPTQFEIDIAAEFNIPIRYININKYKQEPNKPNTYSNYNYMQFEKEKITNIRKHGMSK